MKTHSFKINITDSEYSSIRLASMIGKFSHNFHRDGECLCIFSANPRKVAKDLESLIDFGATSAAEIMNLNMIYN